MSVQQILITAVSQPLHGDCSPSVCAVGPNQRVDEHLAPRHRNNQRQTGPIAPRLARAIDTIEPEFGTPDHWQAGRVRSVSHNKTLWRLTGLLEQRI